MKTIKIILSVVLLLIGVSQTFADDLSKPSILHPKGLLWKIEKPGMRPSYLFGTMHVSDRRVTQLPEVVEEAFNQADQFAMEMILNFQSMGQVASASFFDDGRTLKGVMGYLDYKRLSSLVNKRLFLAEDVMVHMKPWAVLMMLMTPLDQQIQDSAVLDMLLLRRASLRKIPVTGLETAKEQIAVFDSLAMTDQVWLLNRSIKEIDTTDGQMADMMDAYLDRDLARLVEIQNSFNYADSDIDDRFMYQLLTVRNIRMAERMQPILQKGNGFIAIGALHLPGKQGVLHLLEQQGYQVSAVY